MLVENQLEEEDIEVEQNVWSDDEEQAPEAETAYFRMALVNFDW